MRGVQSSDKRSRNKKCATSGAVNGRKQPGRPAAETQQHTHLGVQALGDALGFESRYSFAYHQRGQFRGNRTNTGRQPDATGRRR